MYSAWRFSEGLSGAQPAGGGWLSGLSGCFGGTEPREADFFLLNTNILSFEFRCGGCWSFVQFDVFLFQQMEDRSPLALVCLRIK